MEKEDKLLASLPPSYNHIVTTMLYGREALEIEEVKATLLSNEIMKRPSLEEGMHH